MKKCVNCNKGLRGRQTKFCSRNCKNIYNNLSYQSYLAQQCVVKIENCNL
jgi:predicted nucleic acid-binding Zn ribbon protein